MLNEFRDCTHRLVFRSAQMDEQQVPIIIVAHVDVSAKLGTKHIYTVIALSSAGVPSMPSLPATVE